MKFSLKRQRKEEKVLNVKQVVETEEVAHLVDHDDADADFIVPEKTESEQLVTAAVLCHLGEHKLDQYWQILGGDSFFGKEGEQDACRLSNI